MSTAIIEIGKASKVYRRGRQELAVLENLDLTVARGEFLALLGPSGSGKTTVLNLIGGNDWPTSGRVRVCGEEISALGRRALAAWRARHVGFVFQFYHLIPVLTASQNVELPLLLTSLGRRQRREHVAAALEFVSLSDRARHRPAELSGGQQQRVAIARALVSDPDLILADEPTGDLDRNSAQEILTLLERLNRESGKTILMVTHDPHAAERAQHVVHLEKGVLGTEARR